MDSATALAQLRHAYQLALEGRIGPQERYARHLLGPAIEALERHQKEIDRLRATVAHLESEAGADSCAGLVRWYEEEIERLRALLRPLADCADEWPDGRPYSWTPHPDDAHAARAELEALRGSRA